MVSHTCVDRLALLTVLRLWAGSLLVTCYVLIPINGAAALSFFFFVCTS